VKLPAALLIVFEDYIARLLFADTFPFHFSEYAVLKISDNANLDHVGDPS